MSDRKKLEKLVIRSFENRDFTGEDPDKKFSTPINPESFTQTFRVNADTSHGHGNPGTEARYKSTEPEQLRLEFVLDGTRTMEGYGGDNKDYATRKVHDQLDDLKKALELQAAVNKEINDKLKLIETVLHTVQKSLKVLAVVAAGVGLIALVALVVAVVK
jgi:hypothetical protein